MRTDFLWWLIDNEYIDSFEDADYLSDDEFDELYDIFLEDLEND